MYRVISIMVALVAAVAGTASAAGDGMTDDVLLMSLGRATLTAPLAPHVARYHNKKDKDEVFAFVLECNSSVWSKFDWEKLTTIVMFNFYDIDLLKHAHDNGVVVAKMENIAKSDLANSTARTEWVATQVDDVVQKGLDGFNFDFEDPLDPDSPESHGYTALVRELREALLAALPAAQVSVDVAWSAAGIDGRFYDYIGLAANSDLLFVMAYDEMSQIWDEPCNARPNSNLTYAEEGIMTYQALGIENSKLVLGLPWYGYVYRCIGYFPDNETCLIEEVPFRGCPCSDAAGRQYEYRLLQDLLRERNLTELWDSSSHTPYFTFTDNGTVYQVRHDNPRSLLDKTTYARSEGLAGAGMWAANFLDYSDTPEGQKQRDAMWGVMP